jgi:hypothetical protein
MKQTIDVWEDQVHTLVGLLKYYPPLNPLYKIKYNWVTIKIFHVEIWKWNCEFMIVKFLKFFLFAKGWRWRQDDAGNWWWREIQFITFASSLKYYPPLNPFAILNLSELLLKFFMLIFKVELGIYHEFVNFFLLQGWRWR